MPGIKKGIRIGSARDGRVTAFIEESESTAAHRAGAEGVGVDAQGNVYGGGRFLILDEGSDAAVARAADADALLMPGARGRQSRCPRFGVGDVDRVVRL